MKRRLTAVCVLALVACAGEPPPTPTLPANCAWEAVWHSENAVFGASDHAEVFVKQGDSWRLELSLPAAETARVVVFDDGVTTVSHDGIEDLDALAVVSNWYGLVRNARYRGTRSIRGHTCYYYRYKEEAGGGGKFYFDTQSLQPRRLEVDDGFTITVVDLYDIEVPDADLFAQDAMTPLFEPGHWSPE